MIDLTRRSVHSRGRCARIDRSSPRSRRFNASNAKAMTTERPLRSMSNTSSRRLRAYATSLISESLGDFCSTVGNPSWLMVVIRRPPHERIRRMVFRRIDALASDVMRRIEKTRAAAENGAPEGESGDRPELEETDRSPSAVGGPAKEKGRTRSGDGWTVRVPKRTPARTGAKFVGATLANAAFMPAGMDRRAVTP